MCICVVKRGNLLNSKTKKINKSGQRNEKVST